MNILAIHFVFNLLPLPFKKKISKTVYGTIAFVDIMDCLWIMSMVYGFLMH